MPDLTSALDYLTAHPWAGWLLLGAVTLLLSRKSQVDAWAESHPRVAGVHKLMRSLGIDPWMLLQSVSLIVRGRLPAQKVAAKPDDAPPTPKSGSVPPNDSSSSLRPPPGAFPLIPLFLGLAVASVAPVATSCSPAATPEARGTQAAQVARLGYSAAVVTVKELGDLHYQLQRAVLTEEQAKVAAVPLRKMLDALDAAKVALQRAKPYVEQSDEVEAIRYVREAVGYVDLALPMLTALGTAPPKEVTEALGYLRGFLGGGK